MDYLLEALEPALAKKRYRYLASCIDYILYLILFCLIVYCLGEKYITEEGGNGYKITGLPAMLPLVVWFILFPLAEGLTDQTLGKMLLGIKVVKVDYSNTTVGTSLIRHLFDIVDYMPFLGMIGLIVSRNSEKSQRVGDLVAKTIVIINEKKIS